jgi:opacity protein-like surface antigen
MVACALLWPLSAHAQPNYTGIATAFVGGAHGGAIDDGTWALGVSSAIVESNGFGAEVDLGHGFHFDSDALSESSLTTLMVNATGVWNKPLARLRPYLVGGAGVLRLHACGPGCDTHTDWAWDAGGGALVMLSDWWAVRGDLRYFSFFDRHEQFPIGDDERFNFWRFSAGISVLWPMR